MLGISATIESIVYTPKAMTLPSFSFDDFSINSAPPSCLIQSHNISIALSKWLSPKRTRSYPFVRVYNTLSFSKKITVIPVMKDEGIDGDRDFIQWDTIALMSLLDVYVVFSYYDDAQKNTRYLNKCTNQKMNEPYIRQQISTIFSYHSSALHWNMQQYANIEEIACMALNAYDEISHKLCISFHNKNALYTFIKNAKQDLEQFKSYSRDKAKQAQTREQVTYQPKESLSSLTKEKITIANYLGGEYYLTIDELCIQHNTLYLIESKHSQSKIMPSNNDIKDGIFKIILYTNLKNIIYQGKQFKAVPVLKLTSPLIQSPIFSTSTEEKIHSFFLENNISTTMIEYITSLFNEARQNNFVVHIEQARI